MPAPKGHKPYNKNGEGGRPKKWTAELIEREADAFEEWMKRPDSLWYEDFALERKYHPDNFIRWAKENERFCTVYKQSQVWQKSKLLKGGLLSTYNSGFCKFIMGNTCGFYDRQVIAGDSVNPLSLSLSGLDGKSKDLCNGQ